MTGGPASTPIPVKVIINSGVSESFENIVREPLKLAAAFGLNVAITST